MSRNLQGQHESPTCRYSNVLCISEIKDNKINYVLRRNNGSQLLTRIDLPPNCPAVNVLILSLRTLFASLPAVLIHLLSMENMKASGLRKGQVDTKCAKKPQVPMMAKTITIPDYHNSL